MRNVEFGIDRTVVEHGIRHRGSNLPFDSAFRIPHSALGGGVAVRIVDSHVHFWDPAVLQYPWLAGTPLERAFPPPDFAATAGGAGAGAGAPIAKLVFVECNCRPEEARREVEFAQRLAQAEKEGGGQGGPQN